MLRKSSPAYWQVDSWGPWPNLGLGRFYGQKNPINGLKCPLLSPFEAAISHWCVNCSGNLLLHMDKWFLGVLAKPCSGQKQAHINLLGFKSCLINCSNTSYPTITFLGLNVVWSIVFWNPSHSILKQAPLVNTFWHTVSLYWSGDHLVIRNGKDSKRHTCLIVFFSHQLNKYV